VRRVVDVDSRPITVAADDPVPLAARWQSLVDGRAVDRVNGTPVEVQCTSPTARVSAASGPGGVFGLAGRAAHVVPGRPWTIRLRAAGYVPVTLTGFFATARLVLPDVELRRAATVIGGRVTLAPAGTPLADVTVEVVRIRRRVSDTTMAAPDLVAVDTPISGRRPAATTVEVLTRTDRPLPPGTPALRLAGSEEPGDPEVALVSVAGIATGDVLRIDSEYVTVASVDPLAPRLQLAAPLGQRHRPDATVAVQDVTVDATTLLLDTAEIGDVVLALDAAAVAGKVVRLRAAGVGDQLRTARRFRSVTGADGQWVLPPIGGVAEVELSVTATGRALFPPVASNPTLRLAAGAAEQRRDFAMQ